MRQISLSAIKNSRRYTGSRDMFEATKSTKEGYGTLDIDNEPVIVTWNPTSVLLYNRETWAHIEIQQSDPEYTSMSLWSAYYELI